MIYGPKGIWVDIVLLLFSKLGIDITNANTEEKISINGIDIPPNQKPIADNYFASPSPIPSVFLNLLEK